MEQPTVIITTIYTGLTDISSMIILLMRGVYSYLPLATNAPRTIFGEILLKV